MRPLHAAEGCTVYEVVGKFTCGQGYISYLYEVCPDQSGAALLRMEDCGGKYLDWSYESQNPVAPVASHKFKELFMGIIKSFERDILTKKLTNGAAIQRAMKEGMAGAARTSLIAEVRGMKIRVLAPRKDTVGKKLQNERYKRPKM